MPENLACEEFDFLLINTQSQSDSERSDNLHNASAKSQHSKKRFRIAELIAQIDELVRHKKELQEQLCGIQRTASEVTKLYQREKQQRVDIERNVLEQRERCADLEKQLDVQNLNCEQLQEQLHTKALPVDAKDMIGIFMQLTQRIAADANCGGLKRTELNMQRKLKDYCKSANICIPHLKSPTKKRIKLTTTAQATQTHTQAPQELPAIVPSKPEMCSIATQSEKFVTTRDQGIQHKNTTTTRGTTTASFIKMHDVGTCFPEPKPAMNAHQILETMLSWSITPLSPIIDPLPAAEQVPTTSVGTCTDLCNVQHEINFLPELPAQLKCSDSRPPSRTMFDSVKDELAMPADAAALGGYSHHMAKELLSFLPHNQSILAKMPPQVFDEVWQVMGQMVLVAIQGRSTNSISQADFHALYERHQTQNVERSNSSSKIAKESDFMASANEDRAHADVGTDPILEPPPKIGLELTPIRLPLRPEPKIKPKKRKLRVELQTEPQAQKEISTPTSPTETAIHFLSNLNAFQISNCDNLDIELDAEERQLLELASATVNNQLPPLTPVDCEELVPQSPPAEIHKCVDNIPSTADNQHLPVKPVDSGKLASQNPAAQSLQSPVTQHEANELKLIDNQQSTVTPVDSEKVSSKSPGVETHKLVDNPQSPIQPIEFEQAQTQTTHTAQSNNEQLLSLFGSDSDSDDGQEQELTIDQICQEREPTNDSDASSIDSANLAIDESDDSSVASPLGELSICESQQETGSTQSECLFGSDADTEDDEQEEQTCQLRQAKDSDADSVDSSSLIIDVGTPQSENVELPNSVEHSPVPQNVGKRKRKASTPSPSSESQPAEKRLTRLQAKQLLLDAEKHESIKVPSDLQPSCFYDCSPLSPIAAPSCDETASEPIEIPLEPPGGDHGESAPKALLCYLVNAVKADTQRLGNRKQKAGKKQTEQLHPQIVNYLKHSAPLDLTAVQLATTDEQILIGALITAYGELQTKAEDGSVLERLLTVVKQMECQRIAIMERFMNTLEQRLFCLKERLTEQVAHKFVQLYLQLIPLKASRVHPIESYVNPARLLLAKILYHYSKHMTLLVGEVLCQFPTVLPHREERDYDHADPLITVIKHLLMAHKYDVTDPNGPGRALISKLRFEYHFQPFEPSNQQVIENLVEKLKAGRVQQLSYAFALFCRRSAFLNVTNMLAEHLLPLANSYCDLCVHNEEYDARMECLLQSISMIVKQLPLDGKPDIAAYIALFKRVLVAVPRPGVQQAAVQAILRTQRFGYAFAMDALNGYRPNYELSPLTRAMLRSFAERRRQYQLYL